MVYTAVDGGNFNSLAIQNGGVYSWGQNQTTPVAVSGLSSGVTAIAAGQSHSVALKNGGVYAWGNNSEFFCCQLTRQRPDRLRQQFYTPVCG